MAISVAFAENATAIFVGKGMCGIPPQPPTPIEWGILVALRANTTEILVRNELGAFPTESA